METLKNQTIPNSSKTFKLRWATFSGSRQEDAGNRTVTETQIYVSGFDLATTQTTLMEFFKSKYPSVCFSKLHVDPITKVPKGFGFVHFNNYEEAQRAVAEQNGKYLLGKKIKVSFADKGGEKSKNDNQPPQSAPIQIPEDSRSLSSAQKQQLYDYYMSLLNDPAMKL